jgi:DNA-binding MarR family transcriptional regulator
MGAHEERIGMAREIAGTCIAVRVRLINRVITSLYDEAMRPHGLRISQANILVALVQLVEARPVEVCRVLRIEKSTLSRDIELMKQNGWVESDPPTGGRNQILRVTPEGLALLETVHPAWKKAQAEAAGLIGEAGIGVLNEVAAQLGLGQPPE